MSQQIFSFVKNFSSSLTHSLTMKSSLLLSFILLMAHCLAIHAESVKYTPPTYPTPKNAIFSETFEDDTWSSRWIVSKDPEFDGMSLFSSLSPLMILRSYLLGELGTWNVQLGKEPYGVIGDHLLTLLNKEKKHAISVALPEVYDNSGKKLIVQYVVLHFSF